MLVHTDHNVVTVPSTAVQRGAQGLYAYVLKPDKRVELRWLEVGTIADDEAVVTKGIAAGETVVTAGQSRLQPGTLVEAHTATAAAQEASR